MESASFGLQTAYGVHLPITIGASSGLRKPEDAPQNPTAGNADTPSGTHVTLSAAGQSRLAAERQASIQTLETAARESAAVPQNAPVQAAQETVTARNTPNNTTAGVAATQNNPAPLQQASVTLSTDAATPRFAAPETAAGIVPAAVGATPETAPQASPRINAPAAQPQAFDNSSAPARQEVEQLARQQRERQDVAAQSRQDDSPALAQSGLTDNREVLSP
jgi:hypothetical protein